MSSPPPWIWPRAVYIHVPFCAHHCGYCDFAIAVGKDDRISSYIDALAAETALIGTPQPVETLFIGGGTPTHLDASQLERLLSQIRHWLPMHPGSEFSVEANPETLTAVKLEVLKSHGVTRISLGAQSFHSHLLEVLDRIHAPRHVPLAVESIKQRGMQVSLDLIFGVPGQTLPEWQQDLSSALALEPDHVSTYGLTYEKGTPLWKRREAGKVHSVSEDAELGFYATAMDTLAQAGFDHYEISNFARPGRHCRHNEVYWANEAYFGFGMGAARYVEGRRELNTRDFGEYIRRAHAGEPTTCQSEKLGPEERARETAAIQIRRSAGICRPRFLEQTGFSADAIIGPHIERLQSLGLLTDEGDSVCLTRSGKFVADTVAAEFMMGR